MKNLKYAQDLIKTTNSSIDAGFNMFISGYHKPTFSDGHNSDTYGRIRGYDYAKDMAKKDGIAFIHRFKCKNEGCAPFMYGGSFVCNSCGGNGVDKDWWKIRVEKDGNEFCCHGLDFINLQESDNYAFGSTFEEAIENYGKLMLSMN